jgi:hypothetical protein
MFIEIQLLTPRDGEGPGAHRGRGFDDPPSVLGEQVHRIVEARPGRIDQHQARTHRHQGGVDVRRQRLGEADGVDAEVRSEPPAQPSRPQCVADQVWAPEDVAAEAGETGGVEHRRCLGQARVSLELERSAQRRVVVLVQAFVHQRLGHGGPAGAGAEVLDQQPAVGAELEITRALGHRRLDDLFADHQQQVARASGGMAARRGPVRGGEGLGMVDWIGPAHGDAAPLQHLGEGVELPFRLVHQARVDRPAGVTAPGITGRDVGIERRLEGDIGRAARGAHDHFAQRIPLVPGIDRPHRAVRPDRSRRPRP